VARVAGSTFTPVCGAEERVGHEPLEGVVLEDEPAAVRPEHRQREDAPLLLVHARSLPVRSELQAGSGTKKVNSAHRGVCGILVEHR
jgi:hypothetical protein